MKIFIFAIDSLGGGGAEKAVVSLAKEIQNRGNKVYIVLGQPVISYPVGDLKIQVANVIINKSSMYPLRILFSKKVKHYDEIFEQIEKIDGPIDAIFSSLEINYILYKSKYKNKCFFMIQTTVSKALQDLLGKSFKYSFYKILLRYIYNNKKIIAVSDGVYRDLFSEIGIKPFSIKPIYNPFDINHIQDLSNKYINDEILNKDYIIHVGRINKVKRHDRLFRVFAKSNINSKLLLLGSGSQSCINQMKRMASELGIADKVEFLGFKKNPYPYIKNARLTILTSDYEGLANVIIESLICGTPVVSTDCPSGPREILTGNLSKCLAPLNDEDAFAKILGENYNNPPDVSSYNLSKFSVETIANQYLSLI